MSIYVNSRYENATVARVQGLDDVVRPTVYRKVPTVPPTNFSVYVARVGDRLDLIAGRVYGKSNLYWLIADANPDLMLVDPLPPGTALRVPNGTQVR